MIHRCLAATKGEGGKKRKWERGIRQEGKRKYKWKFSSANQGGKTARPVVVQRRCRRGTFWGYCIRIVVLRASTIFALPLTPETSETEPSTDGMYRKRWRADRLDFKVTE